MAWVGCLVNKIFDFLRNELLVRSFYKRLELIIQVMKNNLKKLIGKRVREARKNKGLTQDDLAALIDKTVETISNIERGVKLTGLATWEDIRKVLGVKLSDLVDQ